MKNYFRGNQSAIGVIDSYQQKLNKVNELKELENQNLKKKVESLEK